MLNLGEGKKEAVKVLCNELETLEGFFYLGDRVNAGGGYETAVTFIVKIGWLKVRECGELLLGRRFVIVAQGQQCYYGSETWCLKENETAILRRTERVMVRSMCGVRLVDRKNTEELMEILG